jgi:hypothetical protein
VKIGQLIKKLEGKKQRRHKKGKLMKVPLTICSRLAYCGHGVKVKNILNFEPICGSAVGLKVRPIESSGEEGLKLVNS